MPIDGRGGHVRETRDFSKRKATESLLNEEVARVPEEELLGVAVSLKRCHGDKLTPLTLGARKNS
jgi:hypothetical protein